MSKKLYASLLEAKKNFEKLPIWAQESIKRIYELQEIHYPTYRSK